MAKPTTTNRKLIKIIILIISLNSCLHAQEIVDCPPIGQSGCKVCRKATDKDTYKDIICQECQNQGDYNTGKGCRPCSDNFAQNFHCKTCGNFGCASCDKGSLDLNLPDGGDAPFKGWQWCNPEKNGRFLLYLVLGIVLFIMVCSCVLMCTYKKKMDRKKDNRDLYSSMVLDEVEND